MTAKRTIERRLEHLEATTCSRDSPSPAGLTAEQTAELESQVDAMIASLDADHQATLAAAAARIEAEPDDAPTGEFGLTDAEAAYMDVLTGGAP